MNKSKVLLESGPERWLSTEQIKGSSLNTSAAVRIFFLFNGGKPCFYKATRNRYSVAGDTSWLSELLATSGRQTVCGFVPYNYVRFT